MRQRKFLVTVFCLVILLLLSSCSGSSGSDGVRGSVVNLEYVSATAGPVITDVKISPRDTLDEFSQVLVMFTLENQGSADLSKGKVGIFVGYDNSIIDFGDAEEEGVSLLGYNDRNPVVDFKHFEFEGYINSIVEDTRSEVQIPIFISSEFSYSTVLEQEICVNTDMYDVYSGNCENPDGVVRAEDQYSPVSISTFDQYISERLGIIYLTFHIENAGKGVVKEIAVIEAALTAEEMVCEFKGKGEMDNHNYVFAAGEKTVDLECEYQFDPNNAAMEKVLYLDLFYDYVLHDQTTLTVQKER